MEREELVHNDMASLMADMAIYGGGHDQVNTPTQLQQSFYGEDVDLPNHMTLGYEQAPVHHWSWHQDMAVTRTPSPQPGYHQPAPFTWAEQLEQQLHQHQQEQLYYQQHQQQQQHQPPLPPSPPHSPPTSPPRPRLQTLQPRPPPPTPPPSPLNQQPASQPRYMTFSYDQYSLRSLPPTFSAEASPNILAHCQPSHRAFRHQVMLRAPDFNYLFDANFPPPPPHPTAVPSRSASPSPMAEAEPPRKRYYACTFVYPNTYQYCGKLFGRQSEAERHRKSVHERTDIMVCKLCPDNSYSRRDCLFRHFRKAHPENEWDLRMAMGSRCRAAGKADGDESLFEEGQVEDEDFWDFMNV
ncbi:hypothetical protein B0T22DRAFT_112540 [Podospora appendiculata]|uniref:C2H2-type domain-containing protein n=1 Tax=Podospora appendiculata TaxID=314037 RepID=A0AAE0XLB2_9PEZI|nr:hypothetical protein B0T22DRAFT_112540 [Podospora appendiculata]